MKKEMMGEEGMAHESGESMAYEKREHGMSGGGKRGAEYRSHRKIHKLRHGKKAAMK